MRWCQFRFSNCTGNTLEHASDLVGGGVIDARARGVGKLSASRRAGLQIDMIDILWMQWRESIVPVRSGIYHEFG